MIRHILADGREVESIEGMVIPTTGPTAAVYRIVSDYAKNRQKITQQSKEGKKNATA